MASGSTINDEAGLAALVGGFVNTEMLGSTRYLGIKTAQFRGAGDVPQPVEQHTFVGIYNGKYTILYIPKGEIVVDNDKVHGRTEGTITPLPVGDDNPLVAEFLRERFLNG